MSNVSFAVALIAGFAFIGGTEQCMSANTEGHHALLQTSNVRKKNVTNGVASDGREAYEAVDDMADAIKTLGEVGADQTSAETFDHKHFMLSTERALKLARLDGFLQKESKMSNGECFDAASWLAEVQRNPPLGKFSQGNQDGLLLSLFDVARLGTTNKYFVEFGFTGIIASNSRRFREDEGWTGVEFDGGPSNKSINQYSEFITSDNIVGLFDKYSVPVEADYVSIDIDSCDLWVFLALTERYRPRAVSVEYNSKYSFMESKTNVCKDSAGEMYQWRIDDMYGASLMSLHKAAKKMGYTMVAVEPKLDVFLVRNDLVCPGTEVDVELFRNATSLPYAAFRQGNVTEVERWIREYE